MIQFLDTFIKIFSYLVIFTGLLFIIHPLIKINHKKTTLSRFRKTSIEVVKKNKIIQHLEKLINVSTNFDFEYKTFYFFAISIAIFGLVFITLFKSSSTLIISLIFGVVSGLIPYIFLLLRLQSIRVEGSYEGGALIAELTSQYRINYFNMLEAIDKTMIYLKDQPYTRKILFRLSTGIKQYQTIEELELLIDEFTFALDTQWGLLLANNIFISIAYGDNVMDGLDDISNEIRDIQNIMEKNKQLNMESFTMIKFIAPATYFFSVFFAIKYFGFTIQKYIKYQFYDPMGLKFFSITVTFIVLNFIIYLFMRKPKYDF